MMLIQKISDYLITSDINKEVGLIDGNMGICIFLYHSYRATGNSKYRKKAETLLDFIYENLNPSSISFGSGVAGIGWGIEHLVRQKFCKGNSDHILKEIDSCVFRVIQAQSKLTLNLTNGLTGYLLYIISRLENNKNSINESTVINQLLFREIINRIDDESSNGFKHLNKDIYANLFNAFPWAIYSLKKALALNIYNEKIFHILDQWLYNFEVNMPRLHIHRISLAIALKEMNIFLKKPLFDRLIKILMYSIDYELLFKELNPYLFNIAGGWHGFAYTLKRASATLEKNTPNYPLLESTRHKIIDIHKSLFCNYIDQLSNKSNEISPPFGDIKDGLSGVGLLRLFCPESFSLYQDF